MSKSCPAVFLDRDGTLLREWGYLADHKKLDFYRGVFPALRKLQRNGFKLVIVTNQSGVGRGYFSLATLHLINAAFTRALLRNGVRLSGIYYCPHRPEAGCPCRKPKPLLGLRAKKELGLDLKNSYMIGDHTKDMQFARNLGAVGVLVLTGWGRSQRKEAQPHAQKIAKNFVAAAEWILQKNKLG